MQQFIASTSGKRLDVFISAEDASISRMQAKELVKTGMVMVNGRIARKTALVLNEGDKVEISDSGEPVTETRIEAIDLKLEVLYEDDECMVINKPAGIPVHPGAGIPRDAATVLHGVVHLFKKRKLPFSSASVLVHRLDKDTTGSLLIAKNPAAHKFLQKQFETRTVKKFYLAIVIGVPNPPAAVIDASIGRTTADRTRMGIIGTGRMREAQTTYRTLSVTKDVALLSCELHTGRTHQIRVHLHSIGHPILGDVSYTTPTSERFSAEHSVDTICLHAWKLTFVSPADNKEHEIVTPPGKKFQSVLKRLELKMDS